MATATQQPKSNGTQAPEVTRSALDKAIEETLSKQSVSWKIGDTGEELSLSISHVRKLFANPTKKGVLPTDRDCWLFLQLCKAKGLNPYVGDAYLVGYDDEREESGAKFSLITAHQALLKRAEASGKKDGMESGVIVIDKKTGEVRETPGDFFLPDRETLVGAWCRVYRKDQRIPTYDRLNLSTFNKGYSRWKADAAGMIVKCVESSAHRLAFPAEAGGLYVREELNAEAVSEQKTSPPKRVTMSDLSPPQAMQEPVFDDGDHAEDASQTEPDRPHVSRSREEATLAPSKRTKGWMASETQTDADKFEAENPGPRGQSLLDNTQDAVEAGQ